MNQAREKLYQSLENKIGNTPLIELPLNLPNGNRIFAKEEYKNPTGSHYDRIYIHLLKALEKEGKIVPGYTPLIETTSGNAGAAFAWLCQELGYDATVILPEGLPKARTDDIKQYGAKLIFTPEQDYVGGAAKKLGEILTKENQKRKRHGLPKYWSPNHSQDFRTANSLEGIASEALDQLDGEIDYFIPAIGNGASLLGPGQYLKEKSPKTKIIAWEPFASGLGYHMQHSGKIRGKYFLRIGNTEFGIPTKYERTFDIRPGSLRHNIYGTGVADVSFPFLEKAIKGHSPVVDDIYLVIDNSTEEQYLNIIDTLGEYRFGIPSLSPGSVDSRFVAHLSLTLDTLCSLPNWEIWDQKLKNKGYKVGRSTAGSIAVAVDIIETHGLKFKRKFPFIEADWVKNKNFLVIAYDPAWKYKN